MAFESFDLNEYDVVPLISLVVLSTKFEFVISVSSLNFLLFDTELTKSDKFICAILSFSTL